MKNIVYAIGNVDFEKALTTALNSQIKTDTFSCVGSATHTEAVIGLCTSKKPDMLILRDGLPGGTKTLDIVNEVRINLPHTRIIVLTKLRNVGDPFLSQLVTFGVYDFISASKLKMKDLISLVRTPKAYKDVEMYVPRYEESKDGKPLFETKVIHENSDNAEEELDDIKNDDPRSRTQSAHASAREMNDIDEEDTATPAEKKPLHTGTVLQRGSKIGYSPFFKKQGASFGSTPVRKSEPSSPAVEAPTQSSLVFPKFGVGHEEEDNASIESSFDFFKKLTEENPLPSETLKKETITPVQKAEPAPLPETKVETKPLQTAKLENAPLSDASKTIQKKEMTFDDLKKKVSDDNPHIKHLASETKEEEIAGVIDEDDLIDNTAFDVSAAPELAPAPVSAPVASKVEAVDTHEVKTSEKPKPVVKHEESKPAVKEPAVAEPVEEDDMFSTGEILPDPIIKKKTAPTAPKTSAVKEKKVIGDESADVLPKKTESKTETKHSEPAEIIKKEAVSVAKPAVPEIKAFDFEHFDFSPEVRTFAFVRSTPGSRNTALDVAEMMLKKKKNVLYVDTNTESSVSGFVSFDKNSDSKRGTIAQSGKCRIRYVETRIKDAASAIEAEKKQQKFDYIIIDTIVGHALNRILAMCDMAFILLPYDKYVASMIFNRYKETMQTTRFAVIIEGFEEDQVISLKYFKNLTGVRTIKTYGTMTEANAAYRDSKSIVETDFKKAVENYRSLLSMMQKLHLPKEKEEVK